MARHVCMYKKTIRPNKKNTMSTIKGSEGSALSSWGRYSGTHISRSIVYRLDYFFVVFDTFDYIFRTAWEEKYSCIEAKNKLFPFLLIFLLDFYYISDIKWSHCKVPKHQLNTKFVIWCYFSIFVKYLFLKGKHL